MGQQHAAKLAEIDRNYEAFQQRLPELLGEHGGEYALLRGGEVIGIYQRVADAASEAERRFADGLYSIQPVVEDPIDLGFFSHAGG